ncbi:carbohydrate kinase family protein [Desulfosoma caldarium]|uniref:Ribokinase n=1 Tax=Desulfosoma caldarium TaxID=610254 RepID=A0A3N1VN11_9BACT|nr:PfkB family carbohydrate kinase [Desulfosoma caldarium]ROR03340.1 ribokinase [Desulfosoma caldarium]
MAWNGYSKPVKASAQPLKEPQDAFWDVFGLGQCSLDYLGIIDRFPQADSKCEFRGLTMQGGGPVATALVALNRWGKRCLLCGVVGDDPFGEAILQSLHNEGVHTDGVQVRTEGASQFAFIAAEPATARRTIFWRRPTGAPLRPDEVPWQEVRRSRVILTDGFFMDAALALARKARAWNIPVVVDAGSLRDGMLDLARWSDHFIASEVFARSLMGTEDSEGACRKLASLGPEVVGVTLGARGSVFYYRGRLAFQEAYAVDVVDTTGCGDVFHGAYVYGLLEGWPVHERFRRASWAAAQVARRLGGRAGIPASLQGPIP